MGSRRHTSRPGRPLARQEIRDTGAGGATGEPRSRDRPREQGGEGSAELAIFAATEKLLAQHSLQDLSVAQILAEAGLSRATFYFYFGSKFSVVASLLVRITDEIFEFVQPFVSRDPAEQPQEALDRSLRAAIEVWERHRPTLRATMQHWATNEEIGRQWIASIELFTDAVAGTIERDREAGLAPDGPAPRSLAAALLWGTQQCLYAAGLGTDDDLGDERGVFEPLLAIWTRSIYGDPAGG
jgi:TetR/AcrR family transcriptional regulator, ethionamide resistance regulator